MMPICSIFPNSCLAAASFLSSYRRAQGYTGGPLITMWCSTPCLLRESSKCGFNMSGNCCIIRAKELRTSVLTPARERETVKKAKKDTAVGEIYCSPIKMHNLENETFSNQIFTNFWTLTKNKNYTMRFTSVLTPS